MKRQYFKTIVVLLLIAVLAPMRVAATEFTVNGINYKTTSAWEVEVAPETASTWVDWAERMAGIRVDLTMSMYSRSSTVLLIWMAVRRPFSTVTVTFIWPLKPMPRPVYVPSV